MSHGNSHGPLLIAELQHGVFSVDQATTSGLDLRAIGSLVKRGVLARKWRHVLRLVGYPPGIKQQWMAAVLEAGPGAVASHLAATAGLRPTIEVMARSARSG